MVAIVDYSAGNLQSVIHALDYIGAESEIVNDPERLKTVDRVILPGVGSFGDAAARLKKSGMDEAVLEFVKTGRPFLGICLGLQLLFASSEEDGNASRGLGLLEGKITRFPEMGIKIPHIGWNSLEIKNPDGIFSGVKNDSYVYFVHSYRLNVCDNSVSAAKCTYGIEFDAAVEHENIAAVQFHPEKSGETGLLILKNFVNRKGE